MKIALVQAPCSFGVGMPPLALAYLYSTLKKAGYRAHVIDLSIMLYKQAADDQKICWDSNNGYRWYLEDSFYQLPFINEATYDKCIGHILAVRPDIIGFSVQNTSALFTLNIVKRIKSRCPGIKILLGGPNCYNLSGNDADWILPYGLQAFADIVIVGEGERTLVNVLARLKAKKSLEGCEGVLLPRGDKWVFNGLAPAIMDLDSLPYPDFSVYDLSAYTDWTEFPILTSRGCVMQCVFCTDTKFWSPYRFRSAGNIIKEMELIKRKYRNTSFAFNDSLINGNLPNLLRLCDLMVKRRLNVAWGGNFRIDKRIDIEVLKKIRQAGCRYFNLGIESASNKVLGLMRKGFTIEEAERFIGLCREAGIDIVVNWVVGFPGENDDDFMQTAAFIARYAGQIKRNTFSTLTINQFSYLEKHKEEFGIVLDGYHLGLWRSLDGQNTIEVRNRRLKMLEEIDQKGNKEYSVVRQT